MSPRVWLFMSLWTAQGALIHVYTSVRLFAPMIYLLSMVYFTHDRSLFRFFQLSTLLLDTLLHNNDIDVSKSGITILIMYNSFATTKWKIFLFYSSSCCACLLTIIRLLDTGVVTFSPIFPPNSYIASNNCSFVSISTFLSSVIFIFITPNVCFFHIVTYKSQK